MVRETLIEINRLVIHVNCAVVLFVLWSHNSGNFSYIKTDSYSNCAGLPLLSVVSWKANSDSKQYQITTASKCYFFVVYSRLVIFMYKAMKQEWDHKKILLPYVLNYTIPSVAWISWISIFRISNEVLILIMMKRCIEMFIAHSGNSHLHLAQP